MITKLAICMNLLLLLLPASSAFTLESYTQRHLNGAVIPRVQNDFFPLYGKKKTRASGGQGFGKVSKPVQSTPEADDATTGSDVFVPNEAASGLTSVEGASSFARPEIDIDPDLPPEERTKAILKEKFGLRTFEEQQGDIKAAERIAKNSERMAKFKQMKDEEFDIFMVIPPPLLKFIDTFLKGGLTITTALFILAGIGITAEAWSVATSNPLPENVDSFIVNTIEPNFTLGLFVLLGFSISLGIFATAQLGSGSSTYQEKP